MTHQAEGPAAETQHLSSIHRTTVEGENQLLTFFSHFHTCRGMRAPTLTHIIYTHKIKNHECWHMPIMSAVDR